MEANTFIKSVEVEGNKIKDIKFYGDGKVQLLVVIFWWYY